jgi:hypothetical protein
VFGRSNEGGPWDSDLPVVVHAPSAALIAASSAAFAFS